MALGFIKIVTYIKCLVPSSLPLLHKSEGPQGVRKNTLETKISQRDIRGRDPGCFVEELLGGKKITVPLAAQTLSLPPAFPFLQHLQKPLFCPPPYSLSARGIEQSSQLAILSPEIK